MALLDDETVDHALLDDTPEWTRDAGAIRRSVVAPSFLDGIELVRRVADAAEAANHHPDIDIRWTEVTFALTTHSAGGITGNDLAMARTIDGIVSGS